MPDVGSMTAGCGNGGEGGKGCGKKEPPVNTGQSDDCNCPPGFAGFNRLPMPATDNCLSINPGCLRFGQEITLANGERKKVENVKVSDVVVGLGPDLLHRFQTITDVEFYEEPLISIEYEGGEFVCSESHLIFVEGGSHLMAMCLDPGDLLIGQEGKTREVLKVSRMGTGKVVGWQCLPDHSFFFEGVLHHNKTQIASAAAM